MCYVSSPLTWLHSISLRISYTGRSNFNYFTFLRIYTFISGHWYSNSSVEAPQQLIILLTFFSLLPFLLVLLFPNLNGRR